MKYNSLVNHYCMLDIESDNTYNEIQALIGQNQKNIQTASGIFDLLIDDYLKNTYRPQLFNTYKTLCEAGMFEIDGSTVYVIWFSNAVEDYDSLDAFRHRILDIATTADYIKFEWVSDNEPIQIRGINWRSISGDD